MMLANSPRFEKLAASFSGKFVLPEDQGYDEARSVQNGMVDRRPAVIAQCLGTADVCAAVRFARETDLEISVRSGGHNVAGRAVCDGGLMIDMSLQKGIFVDPSARTATVQSGVNWGEFNRETQLHGLATTGGVISTTGVAGLTLGGGIGYLMGKYGLSIDNLLSAQVVTAEGTVLTASKSENADLFWGLRGGGGNFGVVTSFEFKLHPVGPEVTAGMLLHPFESARDTLRFFRESAEDLSDELFLFGALVHAPDGSGSRLAGIVPCHCGTLKQGELETAPLKAFGNPVLDSVGPINYEVLNSMLDAGYPKGTLNYWKSAFVDELSDDLIGTLIEWFAKCPSPMSAIFLERFHGAATRVELDATAFPIRRPGYNLAVVSQWIDKGANSENIEWTRGAYEAFKPYFAGNAYINYLDDDDPAARVAEAYGSNFARLREIKDRYDPENVFHLNQNVPPSE